MTVEEVLTDYLSCEIALSPKGSLAWIGQPHMIRKLEKEFGAEVNKLQKKTYKTPGTPGNGLIRPKDESARVDDMMQS